MFISCYVSINYQIFRGNISGTFLIFLHRLCFCWRLLGIHAAATWRGWERWKLCQRGAQTAVQLRGVSPLQLPPAGQEAARLSGGQGGCRAPQRLQDPVRFGHHSWKPLEFKGCLSKWDGCALLRLEWLFYLDVLFVFQQVTVLCQRSAGLYQTAASGPAGEDGGRSEDGGGNRLYSLMAADPKWRNQYKHFHDWYVILIILEQNQSGGPEDHKQHQCSH